MALRLSGAESLLGGFQLGPVDLALDAGSVTAVVGANGAGKTTLLRVASGLLPLSAGRRECAGMALYLRAGAGGRDGQRVGDAVGFAAAISSGRPVDVRVLLDEVGLAGSADRRVGSLSAGERARLTVAVAVAVRPAVLCLDEPGAPLDAAGARVVAAAVSRLSVGGCAVVVASPAAGPLGDRVDAYLAISDGMVAAA